MLLLLLKSMYRMSTSEGEVHTQVTPPGPSLLLQQHVNIISLKARQKSAQVPRSSLDSGAESNYE